ncbi:uncharacterized protein LOC116274623 [Papio anubis]|uniref:uncharacterized protein LOC116274623 n=1 Tax=Papio anubis TaxID=9555 RepID=UPI0012AD8759|nr:uncharacterized protein LOC116274623 [Papio anubis]
MAAAGRGSRAVRRVRALSLPSPSSAAAAAAEAAALAIAAGECPTAQSPAISAPAQPQHAARPPAGRPAPQPAPCRPRLRAWAPAGFGPPRAGGPGPAQPNRHPEDAQAALGPRRPGGLGREALPSREPQGSGLPSRLGLSGPRPPPRRGTRGPAFPRLGSGRRGRVRRAREREVGGLRGTGAAALCSPPRPFPALVRGRAARRGRAGAREPLSPAGKEAGCLGDLRSFPPAGWCGLVTQVDWGTLEYGALPTFLQVRRWPGRQFEEEGAESFCTQK